MRVKYDKVEFKASYGSLDQLPSPIYPEISFAGRSNAGKSSIMNKLFGRKSLVKVSSVPGKTANINFFETGGVWFVDLPGYGYAKVSKAEKKRWGELIEGYFSENRKFALVVLLVDIRLEAQELDIQMIDFLSQKGLPFVVALTKADKISKSKRQQAMKLLGNQLGLTEDQMIITSATTGEGVDKLKRKIEESLI
ncbi:MAG: ribosome biogenesis GTP-binding protein YihA/YsxC [Coriobacteriales bacterium]|jgi:GTP-binding protein